MILHVQSACAIATVNRCLEFPPTKNKADYNYSQQFGGQFITACAVATSCCISDVSSEWEGAIFDPP